ncbi:V-type proton ATPase subunit E 1-like isoform X2 [Cimex lectularius]|uniref:V-type proton ATPase subunit E n=1 Tax=Cimex lectularius TaxID=79782 RepID=A0A8I6TC40_CIMLE|nr:V-type proton ATPase subunit E 1-like isoform X2 [Cimex lectularius]
MNFNKQVERMVAFMDQEGEERAQEIDAKTEEEFNIFVGQMVQTERLRINNHFQKLEKLVEKQKVIAHSSSVNNARIRILRLKEEVLEDVFNKTREQVIKNLSYTNEYRETMKNLILQACIKMLVPKQHIRVRKNDVHIASDVVTEVAQEYTRLTQLDVSLTVDNKFFLPDSVIGGAEIYDRRGKCKIVNTLQYRLSLIRKLLMPVIRHYLFGINPRRKYFE